MNSSLILIFRMLDCGRVSTVRSPEKGQIWPLPNGADRPSKGMFGSNSFPQDRESG